MLKLVNIEVGVEYGGEVFAGDRVDNQHVYYPMMFNKKDALVLKKGDIGYADPDDDGKVRLADTGDPGPFLMVYGNFHGADTLAADPRVHCWHDEGNWLLAPIAGSAKPNALLVPDGGLLVTQGADVTTGVYGILLGIPEQEAELTAGNVLQEGITVDGAKPFQLGVVKVMNQVRLPVAA